MGAVGVDDDVALRGVELAAQHDRAQHVGVHGVDLGQGLGEHMHLEVRRLHAQVGRLVLPEALLVARHEGRVARGCHRLEV